MSFRLHVLLALVSTILLPGRTVLADAEVLRVGLEPFPPLINENRTGYSIDWLHAVASKAGMQLEIKIMPYSRAKVALMTGKVDLIGHTPYGLESDEFYRYATELEYRIPTKLDSFSLNAADSVDNTTALIGTPFGNSEFIAAMTGIDRVRFTEGSLPQLVDMLLAGRIRTVIFERIAVVSQIHKRTPQPVHYRLIREVDAGFAVRRDSTTLLSRLNAAARQVDARPIYAPYTATLQWPDKGIVPSLAEKTDKP